MYKVEVNSEKNLLTATYWKENGRGDISDTAQRIFPQLLP